MGLNRNGESGMRSKVVTLAALITIVILHVGVRAQTVDCDWHWQNPLPQGNPLYDIQVFGANSFVSVGAAGTIVKTSDNCETWDVQYFGEPNFIGFRNTIQALHFIDDNTGWAVGQFLSIIKTTDGGNTWVSQQVSGSMAQLTGVYFTDSHNGWAVGSRKTYNTSDGGTNWNIESSEDLLNDVFFSDDFTGWMVGQSESSATGVVYKTTNGGVNWDPTVVGTAQDNTIFESVQFLDNNTGWIVGRKGQNNPPDEYQYGVIYETTNGGQSWTLIYEQQNNPFNKIYFTTASNGWILSNNGLITTTNGGNSWNIDTNIIAYGIGFADQLTGWITGSGGIVQKTTDGGENWSLYTDPITQSFIRDIEFIDESNGIAVGRSEGVILRTIDGGDNWTVQHSNPEHVLFDVAFIDENNAWAVGSNALIMYSDDGGVNWEMRVPPVSYHHRSVCFIDENHGWIVTSGRVILKTSNGGVSWETINIDENGGSGVAGLWPVQFIDEYHGWIAGDNAILITDDGGYSWNPSNGGFAGEIIVDMYFVNDNLGYCSTLYGKVYRTTNGGLNWSPTDVPTSNISPLISLYFLNEYEGWGCGMNGVMYVTTDGYTWEKQMTPAFQDLYRVTAVNDTSVWAVGYGGTIIKYGPTRVGVEDDYNANLIPENYSLSSSYPNPFNATTTIYYDLPAASDVTISIFDMLGRKVTTLTNGTQPAGHHSITWNAGDFATGTYFYKLTAGEYSESHKMTLLK